MWITLSKKYKRFFKRHLSQIFELVYHPQRSIIYAENKLLTFNENFLK